MTTGGTTKMYFCNLGELNWPFLKHSVSLCNPRQRQVSHSRVDSPSVSCGILDIAFMQLCRLWCITKPFFTPVLLYCSIITTVADTLWCTAFQSTSVSAVRIICNHLIAKVCACVGIHVGLYANAAVRQLSVGALLRAWHQGKMKRPGE